MSRIAHATRSLHVQRETAAERLLAIAPELLVVAATLLALVFGFNELDRRAFWKDEATTYYVSSVRWSRLFELLTTSQEGWHPPTYFLILKAWRYLGDSQEVIRGLSVLFAALTVPAVYLVTRRLTDARWPAALAALLLAFHAYFVHYAQEARTYALTMFLATLSYWLFLRALETGSARRWAAYVVVGLLGIYSHIFFVLVIAAQYLSLAWPDLRPSSWRMPLLALAAGALLTLPLVAVSIGQTGSLVNWIDPLDWIAIGSFVFEYAGGTWPAVVVYGIATVIGLAWAIGPGRGRGRVWMIVLWLLLPPIGLAVASMVKPLFVNRYLIVSLPALAILVAVAITRLPRLPAAGLLAAVLVVSSLAISNWYASPYKEWDWLARTMAERGTVRDGLVLWSEPLKTLAVQVKRFDLAQRVPVLVWPRREWSYNSYRSIERPTTRPSRELRTCRLERVWVVRGRGPFNPPPQGRRAEVHEILTTAYEPERTFRRSGMRLELYLRNDQPCPAT